MIAMYRQLISTLVARLEGIAPQALPLIARLGFFAALGGFFWSSALTKIDGIGVSAGAYAQIVPKLSEAVSYDISAMPLWADLLVWSGTIAEFVLPALLVLGFFSRFAALGMFGFIVMMTLTDIFGHGVAVDSALMPRLIWIAVLCVPLMMGGGGASIDQMLKRFGRRGQPAQGALN